jgi:hypothetical protein
LEFGHLPLTGTISVITPIIVARAMILNGVGGIIYWLALLEKRIGIRYDEPLLRRYYATLIFPLQYYYSFKLKHGNKGLGRFIINSSFHVINGYKLSLKNYNSLKNYKRKKIKTV